MNVPRHCMQKGAIWAQIKYVHIVSDLADEGFDIIYN